MLNVDLHSHSCVSDGLLRPAELVRKAAQLGVDIFALTDHDHTGGLAEARQAADEAGIRLIDGVEISVTWRDTSVHVVGLRIDPAHPTLVQGLAGVRAGRVERARRMAEDLERHGIPGSFEGASACATNKEMLGRTHFARFLVETGRVPDVKTAFRKFLVRGKPGYVPHQWASLSDALDWIRQAGGVAVLAHPGRYRISEGALRSLLQEFKGLGGAAVEVVTGSHTPEMVAKFARYAQEFGLAASRGSDYHGEGESYAEPGRLPQLPSGCVPVWQTWV